MLAEVLPGFEQFRREIRVRIRFIISFFALYAGHVRFKFINISCANSFIAADVVPKFK